MELHQIHYVLAVIDTGSFTAAGAALRVSQSGISTQVQKLERELGVSLFDRGSRRISVTVEGEQLIHALRAAAAAIENIRVRANDVRGLVVGSLRIGTVTALSWPAFFDALAAIHSAHPGVDSRLEESTSRDLIARVRSGDLDVAVVAWASNAPQDLRSAIILDDALVAVVAPGHPWAARKVIRPAELARSDLIALPPGTGARDAMEAMFDRAGIHAEPRWEAASPTSLEALAARGLGVAVASETTLADASGLVTLHLSDPDARSRLGVVWRSTPGPATQAFLAELSIAAESISPTPGQLTGQK
jgi:DNA-binding transcriptional LysR family regulator